MSTLTRVKIALALTGLVLFGVGVRLERQELRWVGLGLVVVAWLLGFARASTSTSQQHQAFRDRITRARRVPRSRSRRSREWRQQRVPRRRAIQRQGRGRPAHVR